MQFASSSPSGILRPRFLLQLTVILTILITLYLTFNSDNNNNKANDSHSTTSLILSTSTSTSTTSHKEQSTSQVAWKYSKPLSELKPCQKIFLFQFLPWWGFASEFLLFLRSKHLAQKLGYVFLPDDSNWNYGRLSDYFKIETIDCIPPNDWNDYRKAYPIKQGKNWKIDSKGRDRKRLRYSRAFLGNLDDWTREEYFNSNEVKVELQQLREMNRLHLKEKDRWILEPSQSLPKVFETVFNDLSNVTQKVWNLNEELQEQVEELKELVGLNKPKWLKGETTTSGSGRGPIIGLHIRLGDKETEYLHDNQEMGITNEFGNLTTYLEAAHDAYRRLVSEDYPPLQDSQTEQKKRYSPNAQPTLLLMTAEPRVLKDLSILPLSKFFKLVQTPEPPPFSTTTTETEVRDESEPPPPPPPKAYSIEGGSSSASKSLKVGGYLQSDFNSKPLQERIKHSQTFVRDLTLLTLSEMDALIVSASSNIGRLAMLIGGSEAVIGPKDPFTNQSLGGKIRSIDAHFYPTSYPSSVFEKVKDLQDLENAATLPQKEDQLKRKKNKLKGFSEKSRR
ncbi:hypothetical protein JCM3765_003626 [Sporobolomyces pararoseus]